MPQGPIQQTQSQSSQSELSSIIREEIQRSFRSLTGDIYDAIESGSQSRENTTRPNYNPPRRSNNNQNSSNRDTRQFRNLGNNQNAGPAGDGSATATPESPNYPRNSREREAPRQETRREDGIRYTGRTRTTLNSAPDIKIPCLDGKCEPPLAVPVNPPPQTPPPPTPEQPSNRQEQPKDGPQQHIGRGHLLTAEEKRTGRIRLRDGTEIDFRQGITREEMEKIYDSDKAKLSDLAKSNIDKKLGAGAYEKLDPNVRAVMDDMAYAGGNAAFKNQKLIDALKSGDREQIAKVVENSLTTARGDTEGKLSAGMIAAAKKRADAVRDPNIDIEQQRRRREGERSHQYDALKPGQDPRGADFEETARRRAGQTTPQAQQQPTQPQQQSTQPQQQPTQPSLTEEQRKRIDDVRAKIEAAKRGEGDIQEALRAGEELKKELDRGAQQQQNLTNQPTTAVPVTPAPEGTNLNNVPPTGLPTTAVPVTPVPEGTNLETMPAVTPPSAEQLSPRARQEGDVLNRASLDLKSTKDEQTASMSGGGPTIINNNGGGSGAQPMSRGDTSSPPISSVRNEENSFVRMQNAQAMQFLT